MFGEQGVEDAADLFGGEAELPGAVERGGERARRTLLCVRRGGR